MSNVREAVEGLSFVEIDGGEFELGWRFSGDVPAAALETVDEVIPVDEHFSGRRTVRLERFEIATESRPLSAIAGSPYELEAFDLWELCDHVDALLSAEGLRLPTEDELEAAVGGSLFAWGLEIPPGTPRRTDFGGHREPTGRGLVLDGDPYRVELTRHVLKMGDGGGSICGSAEWPVAWMVLSPAFRLTDDEIADAFFETLEETYVRPVRRS